MKTKITLLYGLGLSSFISIPILIVSCSKSNNNSQELSTTIKTQEITTNNSQQTPSEWLGNDGDSKIKSYIIENQKQIFINLVEPLTDSNWSKYVESNEYNFYDSTGKIDVSITLKKFINKQGNIVNGLKEFKFSIKGFNKNLGTTDINKNLNLSSILAQKINDNYDVVKQAIIKNTSNINGSLTIDDIDIDERYEWNNLKGELTTTVTIKNNKALLNGVIQPTKEFNYTFTGFKKVKPTSINNIVISENQTVEQYFGGSPLNNQAKVVELFNSKLNSVISNYPDNFNNTNVIELKATSYSNKDGNISISFKLNKWYDENGDLRETTSNLFTSMIEGFATNTKYGFEINGIDEYTKRYFTNESVSFENVISNANSFIKNKLIEQNLKKYLTSYVELYAKRFRIMNTNNLNSLIVENNISLNQDKTISGNIKIKFTYIADLNPSLMAATRKTGDIEYHNFVFENSKIEAYVNTSISNTLSFKIQTKWLQKQLISTSDPTKNFNIGIKDEKVYLDDINELTLQLNNSIFNIDINKYINSMYLYSIANANEKQLIKEVLTKICSRNVGILSIGTNPITNGNISAPILKIELSKKYENIRNEFLKELTFELASLFNFVKSLKPATIKENNLYIDSGATLTSYDPNKKLIYDLSNNSPIDYSETFREYKSINIYQENYQIKEKLIKLQKDTINSSWNEFIENLTDKNKSDLIYKWLLPHVAYGQKLSDVSQIGGFVNNESKGRVLCEGYAHLFQYMGNILQAKTIGITGLVMANADPSNPSAPGKHAWNLINIDGTWLWCDPTWDDSMLAESESYNTTYYLKNTDDFFTSTTHKNVENWNNGELLPIKVTII